MIKYFLNILKALKRKVLPKQVVMGRIACLGQDVFELKFKGNLHRMSLVNMQKARVDLFLEWLNTGDRPKPEAVWPFLERKDVYPMIVQQKKLDWLNVKKSNDLIFFDSFSELTDQKFTHKTEGWSFSCNYSDIDHTGGFEDIFDCAGLLSIEEIKKHYDAFFSFVQNNYPGKKIVYLHFPAILDNREKFQVRAREIKDLMENIGKKFRNIVNVSIPDKYVDYNENDNFPYHYSKKTYLYFLEELNRKLA